MAQRMLIYIENKVEGFLQTFLSKLYYEQGETFYSGVHYNMTNVFSYFALHGE